MTDERCQREFDFSLVLRGVRDITTEVEDALFNAGCSDATLSMRHGRAFLTFSRRAESQAEAILSAMSDVARASVGASVIRVDSCDLVSQADIARLIGRTRALVSQYVHGKRGPGTFPPPECYLKDDESPLWRWCEVAHWLFENDMLAENAAQEAIDLAVINSALYFQSQRSSNPKLAEDVLAATK